MSNGYTAACTLAEDLGVRDQDWWTVKPVEPWLRVLKKKGIKPRLIVE